MSISDCSRVDEAQQRADVKRGAPKQERLLFDLPARKAELVFDTYRIVLRVGDCEDCLDSRGEG